MGCLVLIVSAIIIYFAGTIIFSAFGWVGLILFGVVVFLLIAFMIGGAEDRDDEHDEYLDDY